MARWNRRLGIGIAALALGVALVAIAPVVVSFALVVSEDLQLKAKKTKSLDNLHTLASYYVGEFAARNARAALTGKRFVLSLATVPFDGRNLRNLEVLFSPGDPFRSVAKAGGPAAFQRLTLAHLSDAAIDLDRFTSYAGPAGEPVGEVPAAAGGEGLPILADVSFVDVAIVAFSSGRARMLTKQELGLAASDPILVGPAAKSPLLRRLSDR